MPSAASLALGKPRICRVPDLALGIRRPPTLSRTTHTRTNNTHTHTQHGLHLLVAASQRRPASSTPLRRRATCTPPRHPARAASARCGAAPPRHRGVAPPHPRRPLPCHVPRPARHLQAELTPPRRRPRPRHLHAAPTSCHRGPSTSTPERRRLVRSALPCPPGASTSRHLDAYPRPPGASTPRHLDACPARGTSTPAPPAA
ncbi:hypothetical protein PVAP13_2NG337703 [Panicum virgatum]|uniref:Uncharacterized protein n=1 Tax=Panicum virgatum TaxID=38727 RepID=A0A8T0VUT6_PANVG|nr:hypothetical protein PVAP13_2NG337703 [Panicum virgatum]